jgi:FK506-binding nuclear protein
MFVHWSRTIEPGQSQELEQFDEDEMPPVLLHVTAACFGENVTAGSRSVVSIKTENYEGPVCSLTAGSHENQTLDLLFSLSEPTTVSVSGQNPSSVTLSGYFQPLSDDYAESYAEGSDLEDMDADLDDMDEEQIEEYRRALESRGRKRHLEDEGSDDDEQPTKKRKTNKGQAARGGGVEDDTKETESTNKASKSKSPKQSPKQSPKGSPATSSKKGKKKDWIMVKGGLKYKEIRDGQGKGAKNGDTVGVYYVGQLGDNTIFDKCIEGQPLEFTLGAGEVIKGWELGLNGMKVGGKRRLQIPSKMGYGTQGSEPEIPPNADLTFTIELKSIS